MDIFYWLSGGNIVISLLFIGTMVFSVYAQMKVHRTFKRFSTIPNEKSITGEALAEDLKNRYGMTELSITRVAGFLSDHYNPKTKSLGLSGEVAGNHSVASLAIVAHEMGHARQDAENMPFLKLRNAVFPITNIASNAALPIFLIGFWLSSINLMDVGILLFGVVSFFYVITLPIEINASKRGLAMLMEGNYLNSGEIKGAKKVLMAAALTYIAALASSLITLLRLLFLRSNR